MSYSNLLFSITLVFLISFLSVALVKHLAMQRGWTAITRNDRWHERQVALHGGVGFFPVFLIGSIWFVVQIFGLNKSQVISQALLNRILLFSAIPFGGFVLFLVGMWDDIKPIRPVPKLFFQLAAVTPLIYMGGASSITGIQLIDILFTYFWFVGIINAVNLLDNMDGLASGVVIIASITLMALHLQAVEWKLLESFPALILLTFIAALIGFWIHNWPPASIFMGDAGSLSIGFILAGFTLPQSFNGYTGFELNPGALNVVLPVLLPMMILAVPIFDTTFVTITRTWRSQNIAVGGRDHSSHRMVILGLSEKETLFIFYAIAGLGGFFAVLMQSLPDYSLLFFGGFGIALILIGIYLAHVKIESAKMREAPVSWLPHKYKTTWYKRNVTEMLLDVIIIVFCFYGSYLLRFEGNLTESLFKAMLNALPWVVLGTLFSLNITGVYRSRWRMISVTDVPFFIYGVLGGTAASLAIVTLVSRFDEGYSRSAFVIYGFLLFTAIVGSRLSFRLLDHLFFMKKTDVAHGKKPILIYVSGKEGKLVYEAMRIDPNMQHHEIAGFIDPEGDEAGKTLCGLPVKTETEWLQYSWKSKPRIFIPASLDVDRFAPEMTERWRGKGVIYRFRAKIERVRFVSNLTSNSL